METCGVCGLRKPVREMVSCELIRASVADELDRSSQTWRDTGWICRTDLQEFRRRSVEEMIRHERGELTRLEHEVIDSLSQDAVVSENVEETWRGAIGVGDRVADRMAAFAGSWFFILAFLGFMMIWMGVNVLPILRNDFDPYPFILLNLLLSMIAAFQAPLIMMSQRRQEEKDRLRSQNDYQINLKAELEIRHLHEKLDRILIGQWERLSRIQEAQLELFEEFSRDRPPR